MNRDNLIEILRKHLPEADADALIEHQFDAVDAVADAIIEECAKVAEALRVTRCEYLSRVEDDIRELKGSK